MEHTKLPLRTWFLAAFLVFTTKKGISTSELGRKIGTSQKTAWFLTQKLVAAARAGDADILEGVVEADEAVVSGKRAGRGGRRPAERQLVLGMVETTRHGMGRLRLQHIEDASRRVLHPVIHQGVQPGSTLRTDGWAPYAGSRHYAHDPTPDRDVHQPGSQVPRIHIVFSNLKRVLKGVHTWTSDHRLQSYLDAFSYRFNHRRDLWNGLEHALRRAVRIAPLTYATIIAQRSQQSQPAEPP